MHTTISIRKPSGEVYVFRFDDNSLTALEQYAGQMAADPELGFTWVDACRVVSLAREMIEVGELVEFKKK